MSSIGFYCLLGEPLSPGDSAECFLELKTTLGIPATAVPAVTLQCDVVIVRTEETAEGHGTACLINNYRVLPPGESPPPQITH